MTIATLFVALIATSADAGPGDPVLLDFHASWCGPCKQMRPEVEKLVQKGYPVKSVDIDRSPELSERYQVKAVPTFVVIDSQGRALAKSSGFLPAAQLAAFYNEAKTSQPAAEAPEAVEAREPRTSTEEVATESTPPVAQTPPPLVNPKPWETVVRIKMHLSDSEWGFGSGTIIYSTSEESLILTCAHIFKVKGRPQPKPENYRVPITVDLFDGHLTPGRQPAMLRCSEKDVVGEAIDYDFANDVGLIRIRPGRRLPASRVVPPWWHPKKGMKMYTVGCSHGNDATAWDTTILDPRVEMTNTGTNQSFATIKCVHQPKEGRSGGGLYTTDGYVAGVCDFADPNERVGLYAVPEAIHRMLDRRGLMALYKPTTDQPSPVLVKNQSRPGGGTKYRAQSPSDPEGPPAADAITIPPPDRFGLKVAATNKPWHSPGALATAPTSVRSSHRPEPPVGDSVNPGARPGDALTTDLNMEPAPEARAFEVPANVEPNRAAPPRSPSQGKWRPARQPLPDLVGASPSRR